jgi:hypothetical protein
LFGRSKKIGEQAAFHAWPVEIRKPQDCGFDLAAGIRLQDDVLLFLALLTLEDVGSARMVLRYALDLRVNFRIICH